MTAGSTDNHANDNANAIDSAPCAQYVLGIWGEGPAW